MVAEARTRIAAAGAGAVRAASSSIALGPGVLPATSANGLNLVAGAVAGADSHSFAATPQLQGPERARAGPGSQIVPGPFHSRGRGFGHGRPSDRNLAEVLPALRHSHSSLPLTGRSSISSALCWPCQQHPCPNLAERQQSVAMFFLHVGRPVRAARSHDQPARPRACQGRRMACRPGPAWGEVAVEGHDQPTRRPARPTTQTVENALRTGARERLRPQA